MKLRLLFALLLMVGFVRAQAPILVTPQWLNEHKNDANLVIVQVSVLKPPYDIEHIPGAQFLWPTWLAANTPQTTFNVPEQKEVEKTLQQLGISNNSRVVVVFQSANEVSLTARMFLTLEHVGLKDQVSFLDGGLDAWKKAGLPVTKETTAVKSGNFKMKPKTLLVDKEYVQKVLQKGVVVDARVTRVYDGDPIPGYLRSGHITGAKNIPFTDLVNTSNKFKSLDSLQAYFTPVVPDKKSEVVTYCFIGQTASVVYLAGRLLGYDMKLYDGSMQEWNYIESLPMETTKK